MQCLVNSVHCQPHITSGSAPQHDNETLQLTYNLMCNTLQAAGGAAKTGLDYVGIGLGYAKQVRSWRTTGNGTTMLDCFTFKAEVTAPY